MKTVIILNLGKYGASL